MSENEITVELGVAGVLIEKKTPCGPESYHLPWDCAQALFTALTGDKEPEKPPCTCEGCVPKERLERLEGAIGAIRRTIAHHMGTPGGGYEHIDQISTFKLSLWALNEQVARHLSEHRKHAPNRRIEDLEEALKRVQGALGKEED